MGNSQWPLVSDLQICKDWQRTRFGGNHPFGSGCIEFRASGRKMHLKWLKQVRGLCVLCNKRDEVVGLGLVAPRRL